MRVGTLVLVLLHACVVHAAKSSAVADADALPRTVVQTDSPEVHEALRYVMSEFRRMSNQFRYLTLTDVHGAVKSPSHFNGETLFIDLEFDMLRGQQTRHEVVVFKD